MTVSDRIAALLREQSAPFERIEHAESRTSEEVAAARGTPLAIGGKSLVMKLDAGDDDFGLFVVSAARRTQSRALRRRLGLRRFRFATPAELLSLTGLTPGCVPPFGRPVLDLPLYVDQSIADNDEIAFSVGLHTVSFRMATADYLRAAKPVAVFPFSRP